MWLHQTKKLQQTIGKDQQNGNIFANQTSDKVLISKIYMEHKGLGSKKINKSNVGKVKDT